MLRPSVAADPVHRGFARPGRSRGAIKSVQIMRAGRLWLPPRDCAKISWMRLAIGGGRNHKDAAMLRDDSGHGGGGRRGPRNVFGEPLEVCSLSPTTGFYRDGCCNTGPEDFGSHTVCAVMTPAFLEFSKSRGNDLSTPMPEYGFPGLQPGDRWCLCASRWQEALDADQAPFVALRATHEIALAYCSLDDLKRFAVDLI
jgi:uncharacterized protein